MFDVHTIDTAPEGSRETLEKTRDAYGMIPNLYGVLAESPGALKAYAGLGEALGDTGLTEGEKQVVLIATSVENGCAYCVAAHSTVAGQSLDDATIEGLRHGETLPDPKLDALRDFTVRVIRERGWVGKEALRDFLEAGFEKKHVLGVLTGVAMKTLSNYTNHIAETPLDEAFEAHEWRPAAVV